MTLFGQKKISHMKIEKHGMLPFVQALVAKHEIASLYEILNIRLIGHNNLWEFLLI